MVNRGRIDRLSGQQDFVVTRTQVLTLGVSPTWLRGQVKRGGWRRAYPGVYITHSGRPQWATRAKAALLYVGDGAAHSHGSASDWWFETPSVRESRAGRPVEVSVPAHRTVTRQPGLRIHRRRTMPEAWVGRLSVVLPEETALDLVGQCTAEDDIVGVLTRAVRTTEPAMILAALERRPYLRNRPTVLDLLGAVEAGVESPLELRHHRDVERRHGLPRSELQVRERLDGGWIRADCRYRRYRVRVELDGQLGHPGGRTDRDTWRDNAVLIEAGEITLRYRWSHIAGDPCRTAAQLVAALRRGGWAGSPRKCGPRCPL